MIVKRYYVADMQEALAIIRAELGPDAVILSSKPVRKKGIAGLFQKKDLEVVAAYEPRLESPRAREERESAVYHAAIQAVQDAQNRVLPNPLTAPPPSPGQPLGPIDGRSKAQTRSAVQSAAIKAAIRAQGTGDAPPAAPSQPRAVQPQPAQPQQQSPQTAQQQYTQPNPQPVQAAAQPIQAAYEPPQIPHPTEQPPANPRAAQAAALYHQAANWSQAEQAGQAMQAMPAIEEERPVFRRQEQKPPVQALPVERKLGEELDIEELDPLPTAEQPTVPQTVPPADMVIEDELYSDIDTPEENDEQSDNAPVSAAPEGDPRLEALDRKINALSSLIESFAKKYEYIRHDSDYQYDPQIEPYLHLLLSGDVEQELAHALARAVQDASRDGASPRQALEELLRGVIGEPAPLVVGDTRPIALFMGPTGVGKTTTLVKLATMCAVRDKRKVGLINTDTYRIAAQEQLRTYAEILGVPLKVVYNAKDLSAAIDEMADREIIFVDTAGKRPGDEQHIEDMRVLLNAAGESALPFLTVAAPTGQHAMRDLFAHYEFLGEYRLLLTKTDETTGWGAALNACHLSGMALSYITGGQSVPDDIEQADTGELIRRLLR